MPKLEKFISGFTLGRETGVKDMQSAYPSDAGIIEAAPLPFDMASTRKKVRNGATSTRSLNPELIIKSFNTWAFKREQPGNPERLVPAVEAAMRAGRPLEFVLYWGKGPRAEIAAPDLACLDYLGQLAERVRQAYAPGAVFRLIFTDTHAALNGHPAAAADAYFGAIDAAAQARGFASTRLSDVVAFAVALAAIIIGSILAFIGGMQSGALVQYATTGPDGTPQIDPSNLSAGEQQAAATAGLLTVAGFLVFGVLGLWGFIQGIIATAKNRGRGFGIAALVLAVLGGVVVAVVFGAGAAAGAAPYTSSFG